MATQLKSWSSLARDVKDSDFKRKPGSIQEIPHDTRELPERKTVEGNPILYVIHFENTLYEWPTYAEMKKYVYGLRHNQGKVNIAVKMWHENHFLWKKYCSWFDVYKNVFEKEEWRLNKEMISI